ncbi:MAG: DUF1553 domain-containing protein [Pirellulales bacterium]
MNSLAPVVLLAAFAAGADGEVDFARDVAPLFERSCVRCHHPGAKQGDVSLVERGELPEELLVAGKPAKSYLIELVSPAADGERPTMPKEGQPLSADEVALLARWIEQGANWPKGVRLKEPVRAGKDWWSLQPLSAAQPPLAPETPAAWAANPIDRFVFAKLAEQGLAPNAPADRRTLIRRVTYDLIGLPPTPEEVAAFAADTAPDAYERLVDRLLASPRYGEQWGRHWLDVVRFGESNGFERNVLINSLWPFRDYVIRSFNADKPFDRLIQEHLAGDALSPDDRDAQIATAFLVCGPYDNVGNSDPLQAKVIRANTLDEIIRASSEAFLGLTVGCARCHDHKFDPITQRDYYQLSATFAGVQHDERVVASAAAQQEHAAKLAPLVAQRDVAAQQRAALERAIFERAEAKATELEATWTRPPADRHGTEEPFPPVDARFVRLSVESREDDPQHAGGFQLDEFEVFTAAPEPRNVALAAAGAKASGESRQAQDFAGAYDVGFTIDGKYGARWIAAGPQLTIELAKPERIAKIIFSTDRQRGLQPGAFVGEYKLEASLDGQTWSELASSRDRQPISPEHRRRRLFLAQVTPEESQQLDALAAERDRLAAEVDAVPALERVWAGRFEAGTGPFNVFLGGDPARVGDAVAPGSLSFLAAVAPGYELSPEAPETERRLALARWITARENPLTPRVLANRLWQGHFGVGLVDTSSDFGFMGTRPSHPELLDWLAQQVHASGWRLKPLHRLIVTSQAYRQTSTWNDTAGQVDADSRLLWRYPPRRLAAEEIRDTLLSVAGKLELGEGGPGFRLYRYLEDNVATYVPLEEHGPETYRRAVYHQNARAARVDLLSDFDCPDPAFAAPKRASTTTPLQALTLLNHRFTLDMARALAERVQARGDLEASDQIGAAFELAFAREPSASERRAAERLVTEHGLVALCRALLNSNELVYLD